VVLVDSFVSRADTEAGNERGMICKFCADALVVKMFILQITRLLLFVLIKKATRKDGSLKFALKQVIDSLFTYFPT
jgi:hypothetical protein